MNKKSNSLIKKLTVLLLIVSVSLICFIGKKTNAETILVYPAISGTDDITTSGWYDYTFCCFYDTSVNKSSSNPQNFYLKVDSTGGTPSSSIPIGVLYVEGQYPWSYNSYTVYYAANGGIWYSGGGYMKYTKYSSSTYSTVSVSIQSKSWYFLPYTYTKSTIAGYESHISYNSYDMVGLTNMQVNQNAFLYEYYGILNDNVDKTWAVNEVLSDPEKYGLYSSAQYEAYGSEKYTEGLEDGDLDDYSSIMLTVFGGFAEILEVEIFPGITIGLIIGMPLLLGAFLIILKMIRG